MSGSDEMRKEATRLANSANRAWNHNKQSDLLARAAKMYKDADNAADDEAEDEEKDFVIEHIEHEKNAERQAKAIDQARRKWGPNWEMERLAKLAESENDGWLSLTDWRIPPDET